MSRVKTLALTGAVLFALAGCAQLFEFNLFAALDKPPTRTAADYQGSDGLDQLDEDLDSPAVVDMLAANPALVQEIESDLWDFINGSVDDAEDQQAAILYADLALKTSEGEDLVNNIVEALLDGTITGGATVAEILADIIPAEARANLGTFKAMVGALLAANRAYLLLGASIDQVAPFGEADPGATLPPGSLPGDIAQKAMVAYTMRVVVNAIMDYPAPGTLTEDEAEAELYLIAIDAPGADTDLAGLTPSITEPAPILALLDLAGLSIP